jgi:hypothetical protein
VPLYLVKARGLSIGKMAELGGLIYIVFAASSMSAGSLYDKETSTASHLGSRC